jgi:hypothetical protein
VFPKQHTLPPCAARIDLDVGVVVGMTMMA